MSASPRQQSDPYHAQRYVMAMSTSSLYALTGIASKIPMVSTVRKSVRALSNRRRASTSSASSCHESVANSGTSTPSSSRSTTAQDLIMSTKILECQIEGPSTSSASGWRFKGGVDWETAKTGVSIWHDAIRRMDTLDARRARQMQIDAVKYMHNALPTNLSETELATLEESLLAHQNTDRLALAPRQPHSHLLVQQSSIGHNVVRTTTARLVCWIISLVIFIIPVMMTLLNRGLQYEKEHQISKRAVENGAEIAKAASAAGVDLGEKMLKFKNTEFGAYCGAGLSWTFQSLLEGVNDGIQSSRTEYYIEPARR